MKACDCCTHFDGCYCEFNIECETGVGCIFYQYQDGKYEEDETLPD